MLHRNKLRHVLSSCKGIGVISFIIANYNGSRFLGKAVASALAQRNVDIEVIIVDDCSSDDSVQIAQGLAKADPRVRFIALASNSGPAGARNAALPMIRTSSENLPRSRKAPAVKLSALSKSLMRRSSSVN